MYIGKKSGFSLIVFLLFTSELIFGSVTTPFVSDTLLWSDSATWNGSKPSETDEVIIPEGVIILLDEPTPSFSGITVNGTLVFNRQDLELTADWILVSGKFQIGSESSPFIHQATITLTGNDPEESIMGMGTRGIMVTGELELHGSAPTTVWTKINENAAVESTSLTLMESVDWEVGDEIVIGPTDYYEAGNGASISQRLTLTNVSGNSLTLDSGLNAYYWGALQYPTPDGMSLSSANLVEPPIADTDSTSTPLVLDQRAPVGNLSRNIIIQSPDDNLWNQQGFGVHTMIMPSGSAKVNGVEFKRAGQRGLIRRYAFHWHILSYAGTETLEDATGQYIINSTINSSRNRGIVIHGTNGLLIQNNVLFDIEGHGVFTEDAVERRNLIDNNLVLHVRTPQVPVNQLLKQHERWDGNFGSSCFWLSNPDNIVTNNHAADCVGFGFWLTYPRQPWGDHQSTLAEDGLVMNPSRMEFGVFDNNTTHSNRLQGIMLDNVEIDNDGNIGGSQYWSTSDGRDASWPFETLRRFSLSRYKTWKNIGNGIWDRSVWPDNPETVSADNAGRFFAGSGSDGVITRSLVVGTSLNHMMNGTDRPPLADFASGFSSSDPAAFATYHSTFDITNNIIVNFPGVANERSGVFSTDDYYVRPVEKGQIRNSGNLIINSHPGVKLQAPYNNFTLASALWDPYGNWGPEGNYFVYNDPFLTYGKEVTEVDPVEVSGGVSVPGPFYGFEGFVLHGVGDEYPQNQPYFDLWGIQVRRLDENLDEIAVWTVPEAQPSDLLQHMRDFATTPEGIYELTFPEEEMLPTNFQVNVENMLSEEDVQLIGIQFDGALDVDVRMVAYGSQSVYASVDSFEAVRNSSGATFWQDRANNLVWIKLQGGFWEFWTDNPEEAVPSMDELLYETSQLRIIGSGTPTPVSNENIKSDVPLSFSLKQNYPNPFNPSTNIEYEVAEISHILIEVYDINGRLIDTIVNEQKSTGTYSLVWNAENRASGIYFLKMKSIFGTFTKKMVLLK
ncbi:MAG: T9SS type A sorting domain-containing protein [Balneolaceae bacterium]|nr:T9SS type A sorting domain-containing protein [Balneolaceae bacterium]MBO6546859.1 T9SS type A sorting domain-containing protein [Balneolaceae bacterium]MBO6649219.1 T9SS type A sorting domain-containing protein [Balneolaceae bacterium]